MPAPSCDCESRTCAIAKQAGIRLLSLTRVEATVAAHLGCNVTAVRYCICDDNLLTDRATFIKSRAERFSEFRQFAYP
jgi:hypothetical protein